MRLNRRVDVYARNVPSWVSGAHSATTNANLFSRLPFELGTGIISLSAQDHYIETTTAKGTTLILLRLKDAIEELAGSDGMQIHRSHWVARSAAVRLRRSGGKLVDERQLPASRTFGPTVRKVLA